VELLAITIAAVSAIAALFATWNAYRNVELGQRAFVYGEPAISHPEIDVRLYNDGPGTALDIRLRLERGHGKILGNETKASVRALKPGEMLPPEGRTPLKFDHPPDYLVKPWTVVVRYREIGGASWEVRNTRHPHSGPIEQRRLRSGRFDWWRDETDW
jgi:hypothetical protein